MSTLEQTTIVSEAPGVTTTYAAPTYTTAYASAPVASSFVMTQPDMVLPPGAYPGFQPGIITAPQLNVPVFTFTPNASAAAAGAKADVKVSKKKAAPKKKKCCGCC